MSKSLVSKLVAVMAAVDNIDKAGENQAQHYKYVRATDLYWAVRKALIKENVLMTTSVVDEKRWEQPTRSGGTMNYVSIAVDFRFHDGDSDTGLGPFRGAGWGQDTGDKAIFKAMTGALKYIARNTFLVPDDSDPENDTNEVAESHSADTGRRGVAPKRTKNPSTSKGTDSTPVMAGAEKSESDAGRPTKEEMDGIRVKMKSYGVNMANLRDFILKTTDETDTKNISKKKWDAVIEGLDNAAKNGTLNELITPQQAVGETA